MKNQSIIISLAALLLTVSYGNLSLAGDFSRLKPNRLSNLTGESEFEDYVRSRGGLPKSFKNLIDDGNIFAGSPYSYLQDGGRPNPARSLLIPDSRSLKRKETSFHSPRRLARWESFRTFIGLTESDKSLEVISWDAAKGVSAFFVVDGFGTDNLKVKRLPDRENICLSCHQHGGPIFPRAPWSEVAENFNDKGNLLAGFARDLDRKVKTAYIDRFKDGKTPELIGGATFYDGELRSFNQGMQTAQICRVACGEDKQCRRILIERILLRKITHTTSDRNSDRVNKAWNRIEALEKEIFARMTPNWPRHGFAYASDVIPDRAPLMGPNVEGTITEIVVTNAEQALKAIGKQKAQVTRPPLNLAAVLALPFSADRSAISFTETPEDILANVPGIEFKKHEGFTGGLGDPKTKRPLINKLSKPEDLALYSANTVLSLGNVGHYCFGMYSGNLSEFSKSGTTKKAKDISRSRREDVTSLVENWPPKRSWFLKVMRRVMKGESDLGANASSGLNVTSRPRSVSMQVGFKKGIPGLVSKYCGKCHHGQDILDLPLGDLKSLAKYEDGLVIELLKEKEMPPENAEQPSDNDRAKIIKKLQEFIK